MSTKIVTTQDKIVTLRQLLVKSEQELLKAIPQHIDRGRMFRVYMTAIQTTPGITECDPISVLGAVFQSAQFGLSLDSILGEAFLIPRWNRNRGCKVAQFQMGYKGYVKLARNADTELQDIFAHVVHEHDEFDWELGMEPTIKKHKPVTKNRGELVAAYAVGVWKGGYKRFEIVLSDEIETIKESSDSYQRAVKEKGDSPWISHPDAMWRKTALRRFGSRMPLSGDSDFAKAMNQERVDGSTFMSSGGNVNNVIPMDAPPEINTQRSDELPPAPASSAVDPQANTKPAPAPAPAARPVARAAAPAPAPAAPPLSVVFPPEQTDPPAPRSALDDAADAVEQRLATSAQPTGAYHPGDIKANLPAPTPDASAAHPAAPQAAPAAAAPAPAANAPKRVQRVARRPAAPPPAPEPQVGGEEPQSDDYGPEGEPMD
jgi:recombination protein RecT